METAFLLLASTWLLLFVFANGSLLVAMVTWPNRSLRQARLPFVLRAGWRSGLMALGCVLMVSCIVLEDAFHEYPLASPEGFMKWIMTMAGSMKPLGAFAAITILPTGVCWFWERHTRRVYHRIETSSELELGSSRP